MARLLPNGEQQFIDANGNPIALGSVYFYIPATTTFKSTWQDQGKTSLNTNPVLLDAGGFAIIWGEGTYRQILKDSLGNTIWDQLVSSGEGAAGISWGFVGGGLPNAQTVNVTGFTEVDGSTFEFIPGQTNTGATTISVNGGPIRQVYAQGPTGPIVLSGSEFIAGNVSRLVWIAALGGYVIANISNTTFNALIASTEVNEEDLEPYYDVSSAGNRKVLVSDKLVSLTNGLSNTYDDPQLQDFQQIYNAVATRVDKIAPDKLLRIISKLTEAEDNSDLDDFQIAIVSLLDGTLRRTSLRNGTGLYRYIGSIVISSGDNIARFSDVDTFWAIRATLVGLTPLTDDNRLQMQVFVDGTLSTTDYTNEGDNAKNDAFWIGTASAAAGSRVSNTTLAGGLSGEVFATNLRGKANVIMGQNVDWKKPSTGSLSETRGGTHDSGNKSTTDIRFLWESGDFRRGRIFLEGIR